MRVALDASAVVGGRKGLGRFQARLLAELARPGSDLLAVTALTHPNFDAPWPQRPGWARVDVAGRTDLIRATVGIPAAVRRIRPQVYITCTDQLRAPAGLPILLYVFEHPMYRTRMQRLTSSGWRQRGADALTLRWFPHTLRRADRIVTASTSTARDLVFFAGADPTKISVAMPGPFMDVGERSEGRRERIVLAFIDRDPRDNGIAVIDGFAQGAAKGWELHVVGDTDPSVLDHARRNPPGPSVSFLGRLSDRALSALYRRATIYLDASLYEGFGAQAAEAAAAGLVCVVSNVTSLPEAAGPGAVLIDPHDASTMASCLARLTARPPVDLLADITAPAMAGARRWEVLTGHLVALSQELATPE